jgi:uncharacterized protein YqgC (DUF456 family)
MSDDFLKEIQDYSRKKYGLAALLLILGLAGIILPVIPGIALIALALMILKPSWWDKIRSMLRR